MIQTEILYVRAHPVQLSSGRALASVQSDARQNNRTIRLTMAWSNDRMTEAPSHTASSHCIVVLASTAPTPFAAHIIIASNECVIECLHLYGRVCVCVFKVVYHLNMQVSSVLFTHTHARASEMTNWKTCICVGKCT